MYIFYHPFHLLGEVLIEPYKKCSKLKQILTKSPTEALLLLLLIIAEMKGKEVRRWQTSE